MTISAAAPLPVPVYLASTVMSKDTSTLSTALVWAEALAMGVSNSEPSADTPNTNTQYSVSASRSLNVSSYTPVMRNDARYSSKVVPYISAIDL